MSAELAARAGVGQEEKGRKKGGGWWMIPCQRLKERSEGAALEEGKGRVLSEPL